MGRGASSGDSIAAKPLRRQINTKRWQRFCDLLVQKIKWLDQRETLDERFDDFEDLRYGGATNRCQIVPGVKSKKRKKRRSDRRWWGGRPLCHECLTYGMIYEAEHFDVVKDENTEPFRTVNLCRLCYERHTRAWEK